MVYSKKHLKEFPEIMNKEQMRIACHISKRTALYLLQFNLMRSIADAGILVPALARPKADGGYELISGHRR
ncbi:MAG: ParB N-terminal domain-containing protein, partial [Oscillospiraceae bacterium]|nr:ParB N-terminal domain-containing protein [Oscillospiraceae bacterium]